MYFKSAMKNINNIVWKAKDFVVKFIKEKIEPKWFVFHNVDHTLDVYKRARYLSEKEWLLEEEKEIVCLAALFHDTGLIDWYQNHEEKSCQIARNWLQSQNYPEEKIKMVVQSIKVTKVWEKPKNKIQMILKEADLDNLGRDDFIERFFLLIKEIQNVSWEKIDKKEFAKQTYKLFKDFEFYTDTQKKERLAKWNENFNILKCFAKGWKNYDNNCKEKFNFIF